MRDYYKDGYDIGYGSKVYSHDDYPKTWGDHHRYTQGIVDGQKGKKILEKFKEEGW